MTKTKENKIEAELSSLREIGKSLIVWIREVEERLTKLEEKNNE